MSRTIGITNIRSQTSTPRNAQERVTIFLKNQSSSFQAAYKQLLFNPFLWVNPQSSKNFEKIKFRIDLNFSIQISVGIYIALAGARTPIPGSKTPQAASGHHPISFSNLRCHSGQVRQCLSQQQLKCWQVMQTQAERDFLRTPCSRQSHSSSWLNRLTGNAFLAWSLRIDLFRQEQVESSSLQP